MHVITLFRRLAWLSIVLLVCVACGADEQGRGATPPPAGDRVIVAQATRAAPTPPSPRPSPTPTTLVLATPSPTPPPPSPSPTATPTITARVQLTISPAAKLLTLLRSPLPAPPGRFLSSPAFGVRIPLSASIVPSDNGANGGGAQFGETPGVGVTVPLVRARPTLLPLPDGVSRTAHVPILMYHYLSEPPANADIYRRDLSVAPTLFDQHLTRIAAEGYTTVSLYDLLLYLTQGAPLPEKAVILTFDDGYRDNYENALPLLVKHQMTATFFVVTDFIDEERPEYMSWEMVRALFAAGMSIESHGRNHVSLRGQAADYLVWQALGSLETIEYELGSRPRFVSYPAGEYDGLTTEIFQSANFWGGVITVQGATHTSDRLFELRRVRIRGSTTPAELARLLALDW